MPALNVVDSSGWLEYYGDGPNAGAFAPLIERPRSLVVPVITLYEVFRRMYVQRGDDAALRSIVQMRLGQVIDIDADLALEAARAGMNHRLALADSLILATARRFEAVLWTQDADFDGLNGVRYVPRP
jgi:predicted nucleic acid-binding protein